MVLNKERGLYAFLYFTCVHSLVPRSYLYEGKGFGELGPTDELIRSQL